MHTNFLENADTTDRPALVCSFPAVMAYLMLTRILSTLSQSSLVSREWIYLARHGFNTRSETVFWSFWLSVTDKEALNISFALWNWTYYDLARSCGYEWTEEDCFIPDFAFINDTHCSHTCLAIFQSPFYLAVNIFSSYKES